MRPRDRYAAGLAVATIFVALFAVGSAPRWAACLSSILAIACAAPYLTSRRELSVMPPLLTVAGIATILTAFQVVPWPAMLVEQLSPERAALAMDNAGALQMKSPRAIAFSYAPATTLVELAKVLGYLFFAYACLRIAHSSAGRRWLVTGIVVSAAALALTGLGHHVLGARSLFGVYEPQFDAPSYLTPLLNSNHLAGFLAMASPVALGLGISAAGPRRAVWILTALAAAGVTLLTNSRAGAFSLIAGGLVVATLLLLQHRRAGRRHQMVPMSVAAPAAVVTVCILTLLAIITAGGVSKELSNTDVSAELTGEQGKLQVWRTSTALVRSNTWVGVGRGGFEYSFTRINKHPNKTFSHLENEYLQAVVDWGIPGVAALAIAIFLLVVAAARRWLMGPVECGISAGLVALGIQSVADFGLELPGVALAVIALSAALLPGVPRTLPSARQRVIQRWRIGAIVVAVTIVGLAASPLGRGPRADAEILASELRRSPTGAVSLGIDMMEKHPSDYIIAGLTARALFHARDKRAVRVMNRALFMNPHHAGLHHLAARMLATTNRRDQALVEYAAALKVPGTGAEILRDLLRRFKKPEQVIKGLPLHPVRGEYLSRVLIETLQRPDVALAYAARLAKTYPTHHRLQYLLGDLAHQLGKGGISLAAAQEAAKLNPTTKNSLLVSRVLLSQNRAPEAEPLIKTAAERAAARGSQAEYARLLIELGTIQLKLENYARARQSLTRALQTGPNRSLRAWAHHRLADLETALGNTHQATWQRNQAKSLRRP